MAFLFEVIAMTHIKLSLSDKNNTWQLPVLVFFSPLAPDFTH